MKQPWPVASLLVAMACVGCGGNGVPMASVEGTVTLDGQPVEEAVIRFTSEGVRGARGLVVNGQITKLTTFVPDDGVPVGSHKVTVQESYRSSGNNNGGGFRPITPLPKQYINVSRTPLSAEVERGSNELSFELESGR